MDQGRRGHVFPDLGAAPGRPIAIQPEIAFLLAHGVSYPDLLQAGETAARWGCFADEALVALGILSADDYYRMLAKHLGVPFHPQTMRISGYVAMEEVVAVGAVRVERAGLGRHFAVAPVGIAARRLIEQPGALPASIVITTPTRLRTLVRDSDPHAVADKAANALPDAMPDFSARTGLHGGQKVALALLAAMIGMSLLLIETWPFNILLAVLMGLATVPFLTLIFLRLTAAITPSPTSMERRKAYAITDADLPVYTVLVALYRETEVVGQLIRALSSLDYPAAKLDIKILLEEEDRETQAAFAARRLPPFIEVVVVPNGRPRTKPRALNAALAEARGSLLVVYDAEDVPDPLQLRLAAAAFARHSARVACLQGRLVIDNADDSWITQLFAVEYAQLFDVVNPLLATLRLPIPLGGTSTHFRTAALREVGGWDAWNVTEDADLGLRLAAKDYDTADLPCATLEEAPSNLSAWMHQRSRWFKGWLQVMATFSRRPVRMMGMMGVSRWFWAGTMMVGTVVSALGFPLFAVAGISALVEVMTGGREPFALFLATLSSLVFVAGLIAIMVLGATAIMRRRLGIPLICLPAMLVYYALMSAAAWRALLEYVRAPQQWNKTRHGRARTSRTGALTTMPANPVRRPQAAA